MHHADGIMSGLSEEHAVGAHKLTRIDRLRVKLGLSEMERLTTKAASSEQIPRRPASRGTGRVDLKSRSAERQ